MVGRQAAERGRVQAVELVAVSAWTWVEVKPLILGRGEGIDFGGVELADLGGGEAADLGRGEGADIVDRGRGEAADLGRGEGAGQPSSPSALKRRGVEAIDLGGGQRGERSRRKPPSVAEFRPLS